MTVAMWTSTAVTVVADQETKGPEFGKASPLGLLIIVLLLVATFLLIRSMNKQLRKLPDSFDAENPEPDQEFDEGTDSGAPSADATADRTTADRTSETDTGASSDEGTGTTR